MNPNQQNRSSGNNATVEPFAFQQQVPIRDYAMGINGIPTGYGFGADSHAIRAGDDPIGFFQPGKTGSYGRDGYYYPWRLSHRGYPSDYPNRSQIVGLKNMKIRQKRRELNRNLPWYLRWFPKLWKKE